MQRSYYLDNLCAVLLLHMIFTYHISITCQYRPGIIKVISLVLSFFMSWFFFKGGMMHRFCRTKELFKKSFKRLLLPFLFFLVLGFILDIICKRVNPFSSSFLISEVLQIVNGQVLWPTAAAWFLLSLFIARILFNFFGRIISPIIISVVFIFAAYGLFLLQQIEWSIPLFSNSVFLFPSYFGNICHGLAVYSIGYYLKEHQFGKIILCVSIAIYAFSFVIPSSIDFRANVPYGPSFILAVIYGIAGCIVFNNLFKRLFDYQIPVLSYLGKNSMVYYLFHWPVMYMAFYQFWNPFKHLRHSFQFVLLSSIVIVFCVFFDWCFTKQKGLRVLIGS